MSQSQKTSAPLWALVSVAETTTTPPPAWIGMAHAIGWVAIRDFEDDWDRAFYPGASLAPILDPAWVLRWLDEVSFSQEIETAPHGPFLGSLTVHLFDEARRLEELGHDWHPSGLALAKAAKLIAANLRASRADIVEKYKNLAEAAEALRMAIAEGLLTAYGWRGNPPSEEEPRATNAPREAIPAGDCTRPVTLCRLGIASVIPDDPIDDGWNLIWYDLRFNSDELSRLWPADTKGPAPTLSHKPESASESSGIVPGAQARSASNTATSDSNHVFSEGNLRNWYALRVGAWPPGVAGPTGDQDQRQANAYFGTTVSRAMLRRICGELAPPSWRKKGPRKPP